MQMLLVLLTGAGAMYADGTQSFNIILLHLLNMLAARDYFVTVVPLLLSKMRLLGLASPPNKLMSSFRDALLPISPLPSSLQAAQTVCVNPPPE